MSSRSPLRVLVVLMNRDRSSSVADAVEALMSPFWTTAGGEAFLRWLDDATLGAVFASVVSFARLTLDGGSSVVTPAADRPDPAVLPGELPERITRMSLVSAATREYELASAQVARAAEQRQAAVREVRDLMGSFDESLVRELPPEFFLCAYYDLRRAAADLLREFAGVDVDA